MSPATAIKGSVTTLSASMAFPSQMVRLQLSLPVNHFLRPRQHGLVDRANFSLVCDSFSDWCTGVDWTGSLRSRRLSVGLSDEIRSENDGEISSVANWWVARDVSPPVLREGASDCASLDPIKIAHEIVSRFG